MKKRISALIALFLAAVLLAACVPSEASGTTASQLAPLASRPAGDTKGTTSNTAGTMGTTSTTNGGNPIFTFPNYATTVIYTTGKTLSTVTTGTVPTTDTTATTRTTGTTTIADIDDYYARMDVRPGYENVDFAGHTFTFASPINTTDGWADYEVYAEEDGSGILDASIVLRNNLLLEHYDCFIRVEDIDNGTLRDDFNTNRNRIDLVLTRYNLQTKANGDYYNFHELEIDLDKPWWDRGFIEDATVNGQLYGIVGAFSLTSFDATNVLFYNKTVKETNEYLRYVDFYDFVYNDEWTLDKFCEIVKMAPVDDGDTSMVLGTGDVFGLVTTFFGIRDLYFGAGQSYVTKTDNRDGSTEFFHAFTGTSVEVTNKIIELYSFDGTACTDYVTVERQMRNNTTLFTQEVLRRASYYAGKQGAYTEAVYIGILPLPKLDSAQEEYRHNIDNHMIYMCVPKTCADRARIAQFLEVYAYHSYYTVYRDYLNLYKYTYTTDADSAEMVDIALQSRYFDLAYQFSWAGIDSEYMKGVQEGNNVVSELGGSFGEAIVAAANTYRDGMKGAGK